jgi:L-fuculose-phosphate aldolase
VHVAPDGTHTGDIVPSSELPFHREIYRRRPDLGALIHAHPSALVAFSICRQIPDTRIHAHAHQLCGKVAIAPYACPGSQRLGDNIAATFAAGADCVLLENHGIVIGGRTLAEAFQRFETLEFLAQILVRTRQLGTLSVHSPERLATVPHPVWATATAPAAALPDEAALRAKLCEFVHRAYRQRLVLSAAGAYSARLSDGTFLITPRGRDRLELEPADLVRTDGHTAPAGLEPSRAARLHAAIYARHPGVGSIVTANPTHVSAFLMSSAPLETRTIPESYYFLREAPKLPFHCIVAEADALAAHFDLRYTPVVLVQNEGALVLGADVFSAFDRLEVLEASAEALYFARGVGPLVPMPEADLEELRVTFSM